ncbi:hypothetical protein EKO27_g10935 [Xylaria grammica]|uniref:Uncharacterized protein n=1 Tax=Xylaria grammica TaxID=363999 RepID=A0A439CPV5_9PEZI|nr:hypothetical protein EKO27_g10935 [Xylaria grammica]
MHSTRILSLAALAGTALSQTSGSAFCSSLQNAFFTTLLAEAPTTPADILSFLATATGIPALPTTIDPSAHQNQLCALATALPSSLLPEFQTLGAELLSFGREHSSELIEYITDCVPEPAAASMTSYVDHVFSATGNICTETASPGSSSASNGTYPTGTGSVYPTPTGASSTLIPTAAAVRPTGALIGAAAVGGAIGAAAML